MRHRVSLENYLQKLEKYSDWYCKNHKPEVDEIKKCGKFTAGLCWNVISLFALIATICLGAGLVH